MTKHFKNAKKNSNVVVPDGGIFFKPPTNHNNRNALNTPEDVTIEAIKVDDFEGEEDSGGREVEDKDDGWKSKGKETFSNWRSVKEDKER